MDSENRAKNARSRTQWLARCRAKVQCERWAIALGHPVGANRREIDFDEPELNRRQGKAQADPRLRWRWKGAAIWLETIYEGDRGIGASRAASLLVMTPPQANRKLIRL